MKKIFTLLSALVFATTLFAETVKLKITYNGKGVSGHTVYVMIGGGSLGSGVTDSGGEVSISVGSLPSKSIDLKGEKKCSGAQKSWEVKGYVTLDGSNYAHLKMEEPMKEMADASGGFISEGTLAKSYGLVCAGSSGGDTSSDSSGGSSDSGGVDTKTEAPPLMTREEALANQKTGLENKIANYDFKIQRRKRK